MTFPEPVLEEMVDAKSPAVVGSLEIEPKEGELSSQNTLELRSRFPSVKVPVTLKLWEVPLGMETFGWSIWRETRDAGKTLMGMGCEDIPLKLACTLMSSIANASKNPLVRVEFDIKLCLSPVHVTTELRSFLEPSV